MKHCCDRMAYAVENEEVPVRYTPRFREFDVRVLDGGTSGIELTYCPWCGTTLPASVRDQWFDHLELLGIDPHSGAIPEEFTDERWWRRRR